MNPKDYLCYCGLYCRRCPIVGVVPPQARALFETMNRIGYAQWGEQAIDGFGRFWEILQQLAKQDETCPLCIGGCGNPGCEIRPCAQERGVEVCGLCDDYPCDKVNAFAEQYPELIDNNNRIREIGLDAWLLEQEELVRQGKFYGNSE